jgi:uncharacterized SAM-binding protein YcdF (DUF218 family)
MIKKTAQNETAIYSSSLIYQSILAVTSNFFLWFFKLSFQDFIFKIFKYCKMFMSCVLFF